MIRISKEVATALDERRPVVALESTVISHGLPAPLNLEVAHECAAAVLEEGAVPATIGLVAGKMVVGLSQEEIEAFAAAAAGSANVVKVGPNNLAAVLASGGLGATTVATSLQIAHLAGLRVFATGGLGGVHRGATDSFDVSADLAALARYPLFCVCSGAKAILDITKTVELLETLGVPVIGFQTSEFPAFYSRLSGLPVDATAASPEEVVRIATFHWKTGNGSALIVAVPVPTEAEISRVEAERLVEKAVESAHKNLVRGKDVTPFVLSELERLSGGATLWANRALLVNNARVAARISCALR